MEYRHYDNKYVVRLDPDEEIISCIRELCLKEQIVCAEVKGLGATNNFTVGVYCLASHEFMPKQFQEDAEIVSLWGTITLNKGELYHHLHMSCSLTDMSVVGGHLLEAYISGTCEIVIDVMAGLIDRRVNERTGLNEMSFD